MAQEWGKTGIFLVTVDKNLFGVCVWTCSCISVHDRDWAEGNKTISVIFVLLASFYLTRLSNIIREELEQCVRISGALVTLVTVLLFHY